MNEEFKSRGPGHLMGINKNLAEDVNNVVNFTRTIDFHGHKITIDPALDENPRMTLDPAVPVTPEVRERMNKWMLEFFGPDDVIENLDGSFVMGAKRFEVVKAEVEAHIAQLEEFASRV